MRQLLQFQQHLLQQQQQQLYSTSAPGLLSLQLEQGVL